MLMICGVLTGGNNDSLYWILRRITSPTEAVEAGTITEERIDESVRKILTQKSEMGLLKYKEEETETTTTT